MEESELKKYFFLACVFLIVFVSYLIIKSFMVAILSGMILAYLLLPVQKILSKKINKKISAFIIVIGLFIIIAGIGYFISNMLITELSNYVTLENFSKITDTIFKYLSDIGFLDSVKPYFGVLKDKTTEILFSSAVPLITSIPHIAFTIFLTLFLCFFLLIEWDDFVKVVKRIIPFKNKEEISSRSSKIIRSIVYGYFLIALIDFTIAIIGFYIAGVKLFVILSLLVGIAAFVPMVGTGAIWIPLLIIEIFRGNIYSSVVILITGISLSFLIDTLFVNVVIGKKARIHPVIMLLGILGGIPIFGFFGFIIGPLILSFSIEFIKLIENSN